MFFRRKRPLCDLFTEKFVDIHSHLLPGLDDGAKTLEHSIELIHELKKTGINKFITTPHIMSEVYPNTPELINQKLQTVQQAMLDKQLGDVQLKAAAEYMLDEQFTARIQKKELLTIDSAMVLVELSYLNPPINLNELLFELQLAGYTPLLAHPERYIFWHKQTAVFENLKNAGCKFQLNILSLTKHYGDSVFKTASYLLKNNMIDFVGTDVHHKHHIQLLHQKVDKKLFDLMLPVVERNSSLLS
jgi:tyrosine-protein phosphatase YwqE